MNRIAISAIFLINLYPKMNQINIADIVYAMKGLSNDSNDSLDIMQRSEVTMTVTRKLKRIASGEDSGKRPWKTPSTRPQKENRGVYIGGNK